MDHRHFNHLGSKFLFKTYASEIEAETANLQLVCGLSELMRNFRGKKSIKINFAWQLK